MSTLWFFLVSPVQPVFIDLESISDLKSIQKFRIDLKFKIWFQDMQFHVSNMVFYFSIQIIHLIQDAPLFNA